MLYGFAGQYVAMSGYSRRRLLAVGSTVTVGAIAGCTDSETTPETTAGDGPVLETITLENLNNRSQTLDIIIQWDDTIEYWEEHELEAISDSGDSSLLLDGGWPTDPGEFQVTIRLGDGTREQFSSTELPDRDCVHLAAILSRDGELSILTEVSDSGCRDETDTEDS